MPFALHSSSPPPSFLLFFFTSFLLHPMTENFKTTLFSLTAILVALTAYLVTRPVTAPGTQQQNAGALLYPEFKDPLAVGALEIFSFDRESATPKDFKVALVNGNWVIPSHENYPTDAEKQLPEAAGSLLDLKILEVKTADAAEHEQYGVLDPDPTKNEIKSTSEGVGTKVVLDDKSGRNVMRLIIGKEDPTQPGVRFVRRAGQAEVYATKIDTSKLSTKFEDWIEPDLLKVNAWDIASVDLETYSVDEAAGGIIDGDVIRLTYDDAATENKWTLANAQAGEEVDPARLDAMRDALDDLRIVDVRRKPAGLSAELKTKEGMTLDRDAMLSLQSKGFFITRDGELVSNEGEMVVGTKEGIEYGLRFGEIATDSTAPSAGAAGEAEKGQNRYVFITAQFNKDRIEPPLLQALPGEEAPAAPETEAPSNDEEAPAAPDPDDVNAIEAEPAATEEPAASEAQPEGTEAAPSGTCQVADPSAETETAADAAPAEATEAAAPSEDITAQSPDQVAIDAERQRIEAENKRQQTLYDQKVADGEKKAEALNARFADWYYVISDEMYRKIRVDRAAILKNVNPLTKEPDTMQEFEQLRNALPAAPAGPAVDGEAPAAPTNP
jgi:hypothetical protein